MANVLRILRLRDRRNHLIHHDLHRSRGIAYHYFPRLAVEVSRSYIPVLSFAAIHRQLDGFSIRPMERLIPVQNGLHKILARRKVAQTAYRISIRMFVHYNFLPWPDSLDVHAKHDLRLRSVIDLHARFIARISRQEDEKTSIHGFITCTSNAD